jgi:hypothetical protein
MPLLKAKNLSQPLPLIKDSNYIAPLALSISADAKPIK